MMILYAKGQRWISETEPELGLGTLVQASDSRLNLLFPASGETRQYARDNAPLKRVRFRVGDRIESHDQQPMVVDAVREEDGLITYLGEGKVLPEAQLNDRISVHGPEERLFAGAIDPLEDFQLRRRTLEHQHRRRQSGVRGFVGGRIDLIPHQLYIAHEVSSRQAPRVLLSDEVGLGKTIEACLILHRLLVSGRAKRVLILVPESLVHQWLVEMLRRFNILMSIYDEERCAAIDSGNPDANPFLDDQLVLCSLGFLSGSPARADQALEADWDVLVVDEAHHLEWAEGNASADYKLVEALGTRAEGLLLLTATPEQLGPEGHFARLRLLDPDRYNDWTAYQAESDLYRELAEVAQKLRENKKLTSKNEKFLASKLREDREEMIARLDAVKRGDANAREALLQDLLDLHGPGRVVFRNTRAAMSGFPKRQVRLVPLKGRGDHADWVDQVSTEFAVDAGDRELVAGLTLENDPRVDWLAALLQEIAPEKILLICRSQEKVIALDEALRRRINVKAGLFHEGLTLVQRDRNAAWFAGEEEARLLLCSEIGSEGRNFQFAHHLVLFDLPLNPELLEQRIGRLDRIGQTQDIWIHVPYLSGSPQEVLARWYQEGLNAFESSLEGGHELMRQFGRQVHDLALEFPAVTAAEAAAELKELLQRTAKARTALALRLEQGRDRLLEMNSFRPEIAQKLVDAIGREDSDSALEEYMLDVFEAYGVHAELLAPATYYLNPRGVTTDAFPAIPEGGLVVTFDRQRALGREDVGFLTWDHPMVTGAMDLVLGTERGNCGFAAWPEGGRRLMMELFFVLETVAEGRLHVDRFLPGTPLRVVVDQDGVDRSDAMPEEAWAGKLRKASPYPLLDNPTLRRDVLPAMVKAAHEAAQARARTVIARSHESMSRMLGHEIDRLKALQKVNGHIRPSEIELTEAQQRSLAKAIAEARVRLDSVRLVVQGA